MSFITSALGGSLLGGVLSVVQRFADVFVKKKEADIEIARAKALSELKVKEGELNAFTASQSQSESDYDPDPLPASAPVWAIISRMFVDCLRVLVDAFRVFTRPGLTWALVIAVVYLMVAGKLPNFTLEAIAADLVFTMSTAVMWWFGSRPLQRTAGKP